MNCKKDSCEKCLCMKRKHGGCADCEKKAIKVVQESGRNLNETIEFVKESGETIDDLYVAVDGGFDDDLECRPSFALRSAIDILRGVCIYCSCHDSEVCNECMWSSRLNSKDYWFFDKYLLDNIHE